jgi:hypothetical protein
MAKIEIKSRWTEVEQQAAQARAAMARHGYTSPAAVTRTWLSARRYYMGFNFRPSVVGESYTNDDGSRSDVLAIVLGAA